MRNFSLIRSMTSKAGDLKKTCLYNFHNRRQARLEPFAGYLMPIVYKNQTIRSEHMQTRTQAAAFDVSHMMQVIVRGDNRFKFIEQLVVADVENMVVDRCALSLFLNKAGGIIDDCIISKRKDHLHIVSNAGNADKVWLWLNTNLPLITGVELERLDGKGLIALQGPKAAQVLQEKVRDDLKEIDFMTTLDAHIEGIGNCQVTRCGYTGEDGFEISVAASAAEALMEDLCSKDEVRPAGLGARDTLRLEAGLCLHGHDINEETTPSEAALNWTVHKRRRVEGGFLGSDVVLKSINSGCDRKRVGLVSVSGGPPVREGCKVMDAEGKTVLGTVTSGNFAPSLEKNIAMGYLPAEMANQLGRSVFCDVRGKLFEYKISKLPFVQSNFYVRRN